jgi:hypothetical protein
LYLHKKIALVGAIIGMSAVVHRSCSTPDYLSACTVRVSHAGHGEH